MDGSITLPASQSSPASRPIVSEVQLSSACALGLCRLHNLTAMKILPTIPQPKETTRHLLEQRMLGKAFLHLDLQCQTLPYPNLTLTLPTLRHPEQGQQCGLIIVKWLSVKLGKHSQATQRMSRNLQADCMFTSISHR